MAILGPPLVRESRKPVPSQEATTQIRHTTPDRIRRQTGPDLQEPDYHAIPMWMACRRSRLRISSSTSHDLAGSPLGAKWAGPVLAS